MKKIEPILNAEILPGKKSAGIELGISFDYFIKNANYIIKQKKEECDVSSTSNFWFIYHRDETVFGMHIDETYCYWDNNVVLEFTGDEKILTVIHVLNDYSGRLFNTFRIGDDINDLLGKCKFAFIGDVHRLVDLNFENNNLFLGAYISTNYLCSYEEYPSQISESITIYK